MQLSVAVGDRVVISTQDASARTLLFQVYTVVHVTQSNGIGTAVLQISHDNETPAEQAARLAITFEAVQSGD